jgi:hypothetical protein
MHAVAYYFCAATVGAVLFKHQLRQPASDPECCCMHDIPLSPQANIVATLLETAYLLLSVAPPLHVTLAVLPSAAT